MVDVRSLHFDTEDDLELFQKEASWRREREYELLTEGLKHRFTFLQQKMEELNHLTTHLNQFYASIAEKLVPLRVEQQVLDNVSNWTTFTGLSEEMLENNFMEEFMANYSQLFRNLAAGNLSGVADIEALRPMYDKLSMLIYLEGSQKACEYVLGFMEKNIDLLATHFRQLQTDVQDQQHSRTLQDVDLVIQNRTDVEEGELDEQLATQAIEPDGPAPAAPRSSLTSETVGKISNDLKSLSTTSKTKLQQLLEQYREMALKSCGLHVQSLNIADNSLDSYMTYAQMKMQRSQLDAEQQNLETSIKDLLKNINDSIEDFYRIELDDRDKDVSNIRELQQKMNLMEQQLSDIRNKRDELVIQQQMRNPDHTLMEDIERTLDAIISSRSSFIDALQTRMDFLEHAPQYESEPAASMTEDSSEVEKLKLNNSSLCQELPGMHAAYDKVQAQLAEQLSSLQSAETEIAQSHLERARATQKYFAAMKARDVLITEHKMLKVVEARSQDLMAKLRERETALIARASTARKALSVFEEIQQLYQKANQQTLETEKNTTHTKRAFIQKINQTSQQITEAQQEILDYFEKNIEMEEQLALQKVQLEYVEREKPQLEKAYETEEAQVYKTMLKCSSCNFANWKNRLISICGHAFCEECIEDMCSQKHRKCPTCERPFNRTDVVPIHL
ncbi:ubiquitin-protein ligase E3 Brl1 [Schizosaccharomyces japonicus yFS275]|uniref:E3 ubiquitin protein ligase n=1 Tax=Schizosaccharomyces japonicus (strain yFS275 / FY16936) TaxID=402676 RepID=B6K324_SCHJY|nr:ubiquitin-protein ligase E3 Brl1 [Schizosaccharomyces japonicus yFS275]EEB07881.1 ubiquitin-protein ligase E3 Brl1 [Schizosaccharomyces japonicus yFS275]